jgi:peptide deformylase
VKVSGINERGLPVTVEAEGLLSRCLQHEMDHLDGVVMIDRLRLPQRLKALWDIRQRKKAGLW